MRRIVVILCAAILVGWVGMASGANIENLYGDIDGFGLSVEENTSFDWSALPKYPHEEGMTDFFTAINNLPLTWTHTYSLSGIDTITSATLEIFSGGQGKYGVSEVFLDGRKIGTLTNGDSGNINYARKDVIDLLPFVRFLDGNNVIRVETCIGPEGAVDNWVLDYSLLTITSKSANVPIPPSIFLFCSGLMGLVALSRKRTRSPIH